MNDNKEMQALIYDLVGRNRYEWKRIARNLYTSAKIIFEKNIEGSKVMNEYLEKLGCASDEWVPEAGIYDVGRMLAGMAIENLIKCIIIQNDPTNVSEGKINEMIGNHDLRRLIEMIPRFIVNKNEIELMDQLTANILWIARYPIPKKSTHSRINKYFDGEPKLIDSLYNRLLEESNKRQLAK